MMFTEPKFWIAAVLLAGGIATVNAVASESGTPDLEGAALVVVDIQAFYFEGGRIPLVDPEAASANARRLVDRFRKAGRPVIHVQHLPRASTHRIPPGSIRSTGSTPTCCPGKARW